MHCLHALPCCRFPVATLTRSTSALSTSLGSLLVCREYTDSAPATFRGMAAELVTPVERGRTAPSGVVEDGVVVFHVGNNTTLLAVFQSILDRSKTCALPDCIHPRRIVPETRRSLGCRKRGT